MKGIVLSLLIFSWFTTSAQKTEILVKAGSGLFFFSGKTPVAHQNAYGGAILQNPYTVPFGRTPGFSFTAGGNAKYIFKNNLLAGGSLEFQSLSSKSVIDTLFIQRDRSPIIDTFPVAGSSTLRLNCIAISPFFGKRINSGHVSFDITAGLDVAFILRAHEKRDIPAFYSYQLGNRDIHTRNTDIRLRLMAEMNIKKINLFAGYSKGLTNYYPLYEGAQPEAFSNFIQFGIGYRLK